MIDNTYFTHRDTRIHTANEFGGYLQVYIDDKVNECLRLVLGEVLYIDLWQHFSPDMNGIPELNADAPDKYQKLVNGESYDGKVWPGFADEERKRSFLAYYVFWQWCIDDEAGSFSTGQQVSDVENSITINNERKRILAYNKFVSWVAGCDNGDTLSLYEYLHDRTDVLGDMGGKNLRYRNVWNI